MVVSTKHRIPEILTVSESLDDLPLVSRIFLLRWFGLRYLPTYPTYLPAWYTRGYGCKKGLDRTRAFLAARRTDQQCPLPEPCVNPRNNPFFRHCSFVITIKKDSSVSLGMERRRKFVRPQSREAKSWERNSLLCDAEAFVDFRSQSDKTVCPIGW